ncbi:MAG: chain-length determining protein [Bacteroidaceae bacterium]|nr:chain-length determining protein [Bacteroidaceae bacterium]
MAIFSNINFFWLLRRIWSDRRRIIRNVCISVVVALVIAFSIPKTYECSVVLAPESSKNSSMGSLASLASLAGVSLNGATGEDAIYPELYPQIVGSTNFMAELYAMNVQSGDGEINTTLYKYLAENQKMAWWEFIVNVPKRIRAMFASKKTGTSVPENVSYYSYSEAETSVINKLNKLVTCKINPGNDVVTISATMQDAKIAAQVADKVASQLQEYVTDYRTSKAKKDYEYSYKLYEEAKADYDRKQADFARYADSHALGTMKNFYRIEEDRLRDEAQLAYSIYTQMAQQKEIAKAKVQENTPVFSVMQPAVVPILAVSPRKMFILISVIFLTFFGHVCWLLIEKDAKEVLKEKRILRRKRVEESSKT